MAKIGNSLNTDLDADETIIAEMILDYITHVTSKPQDLIFDHLPLIFPAETLFSARNVVCKLRKKGIIQYQGIHCIAASHND